MDAFDSARARLFGIAYRMLGSRADAEDVVQDTWLRWREVDASSVLDPDAFLATIATRLAINALTSARARRETYVGPWLPEPIDSRADPHVGAENSEALGIGVLMLLERLSPKERAAYVLGEAFDYSYARIAEILEVTEANARQLGARARQHLGDERRAPVEESEQARFLHAFLAAAQKGDVSALERMFADDVVSYADGGSHQVRASRVPVTGRATVAKFVTSFATKFWDGVTTEPIVANGAPALRLLRDGVMFALLWVEASSAGIDRLLWQMNPDKLIETRA